MMSATASSSKDMSATRCVLRGLSLLTAYVVFGTLTSVIAAVFGMFFVMLTMGGVAGIFATVLIPVIPLIALPVGFLLSMPVSFVVLPVIALLLRRRPATHLFASGVGGMMTGAAVTMIWASHKPFPKIDDGTIYIMAGALAGLVAGMSYAAMVRNTRR